MASSAPVSYSIPQRALHWLTLLLVLYNLIAESSMGRVTRLLSKGETPTAEQMTASDLHLCVGIAILAVTVLRLILRGIQGAPAAPAGETQLFKLLSKIGHWSLYFLLVAMPLTGLAKYYLGNEIAGEIHGEVMKVLLWLLIIAHVGAVLIHQFFWKTNIMARMTKGV